MESVLVESVGPGNREGVVPDSGVMAGPMCSGQRGGAVLSLSLVVPSMRSSSFFHEKIF